jgi:hypothetical protein
MGIAARQRRLSGSMHGWTCRVAGEQRPRGMCVDAPLARNMRRLRAERHLSQEGLAYRTDLSGEESARLR